MQNVRDEEVLRKFGNRLRELRRIKGMTQEELSYQSGISLGQIGKMETGKVNSTICSLVVLAKTLEIEPLELLRFQS